MSDKELKERIKEVHFKLEGEKEVNRLLRERLKAIDNKESKE